MNKARLQQYAIAVPLLIYGLALAYFSSNPYAWFEFPLDDAWIHRVYSQSLAFGHGFSYNQGTQQSGFTSPLWVIVTAPAHWLEALGIGLEVFAVKAIGVALAALCVHLLHRIVLELTSSARTSLLAAAIFACEPILLFSALSGMEPVLLVALLLGCAHAALGGRTLFSLFLAGLAVVARPEAVIFAAPLALGSVYLSGQLKLFRSPYFWMLPLAPGLLWVGFCRFFTERWLPSPFYVKASGTTLTYETLELTLRALFSTGLTATALGMLGLIWFTITVLKFRSRAWLFALGSFLMLPLIFAFAIVLTREFRLDGYYWTRWIDPAHLLLSAAAAAGVALMIGWLWQTQMRPRVRPALAGLVCALFAASVVPFSTSYAALKSHLASDARAIARLNVAAGKWVGEHTAVDDVIALNDAGAIRYFGGRRSIDLLGLNNYKLANGEVSVEAQLLSADWLVVFQGLMERPERLALYFEPVGEFRVTAEEYTVCPCPAQHAITVFKRRRLEGS